MQARIVHKSVTVELCKPPGFRGPALINLSSKGLAARDAAVRVSITWGQTPGYLKKELANWSIKEEK